MPSPDQVLAAGANVAHKTLCGGVADLRPMPRTLIDEGTMREVYRYRPGAGSHPTGSPVLLVTPLAAPSLCFDLRRGCSLVEHLVGEQRPTYLVEYGEVSFADRHLGIEHWIDETIPEAVRVVHEHAGEPVHLVGWSLGGLFAVLTAAERHDLPIASVTAAGTPVDVTRVPMIAPLRPLVDLADGKVLTAAYRVLGGAPKPLVRRAFQVSSLDKVITKPVAMLTHLDDEEFLAQLEAVDRFTANMIAYPGRTFGQLYHRAIRENALAGGGWNLDDDRRIELSDLHVPLLVLAGSSDGIAPIDAVRPLAEMVPHSKVRFEVVPGGHLGMLTGRAARATTWRLLDEFLAEHDPEPEEPRTGSPG
ncbi:MAG: alpha/beta fold hydrolase [Propionibacteriales bacterium]|nr:alpha/beta fold hydrolase [Propionibacteriales bacterium]